VSGRRVDLPVSVLATLAARERLGPLHLALQPEPLWLPDEEQAATDGTVNDALAEAGLLDGRGKADVEFLDLLPLLTAAEVEYYGWFTHPDSGETWSALAAGRGLEGVLAVRAGDWVALARVSRRHLADELAEQLPDRLPGGGSPWTVRVIDLEDAGRRGVTDRAMPGDVREVVKVVQRPVHGSGELYAAQRDDLARYTRLEAPLHYVDTDWGRYLNYTTGTGDEAAIHIAPATPATLARALERLRASLTG
jgi:hypothetical protein